MPGGGRACVFCGANADIVPIGVLDEKWYRRCGGEPVVALDHGWYTRNGVRTVAANLDPSKFFGHDVRAVCDFCVHGWIEDMRWRAEPTFVSLLEGRSAAVDERQKADLVRWAQVTAVLAEMVDDMPRASTYGQRHALRTGAVPTPPISVWCFAVRQRLPARVHLSQIPISADDQDDFVQVISVDLARVSVLALIPSNQTAGELVERSAIASVLAGPAAGGETPDPFVRTLDLARTPHPHQVAVQRLCSASSAPDGRVHDGGMS